MKSFSFSTIAAIALSCWPLWPSCQDKCPEHYLWPLHDPKQPELPGNGALGSYLQWKRLRKQHTVHSADELSYSSAMQLSKR
jgi:hypothetical protein